MSIWILSVRSKKCQRRRKKESLEKIMDVVKIGDVRGRLDQKPVEGL